VLRAVVALLIIALVLVGAFVVVHGWLPRRYR
jgi:formate hydrogenlyase subunit 3/multisubunit Na+/H+ antiporter MnhD subunit